MELFDIKLRAAALRELIGPLPIAIGAAICRHVRVRLPWSKIKSEPIFVYISLLELELLEDDGTSAATSTLSSLLKPKDANKVTPPPQTHPSRSQTSAEIGTSASKSRFQPASKSARSASPSPAC